MSFTLLSEKSVHVVRSILNQTYILIDHYSRLGFALEAISLSFSSVIGKQ